MTLQKRLFAKNRRFIALLLFFTIPAFMGHSQTNVASLVNPFIGTGGHGHTFPGAVLPFGMVQLSPDTRVDGSWDGCSGYHYSDTYIYGFSHTHLSGTGCSDWGDVLLMPYVGAPSTDNKVYGSSFLHTKEKASAGYYEVTLNDDQVKVQLTVTPRVGIHKYTFPKTKQANIVLDLLHRDKTLDCSIMVIDSVTVSGFRISEAWAKKQYVYFYMQFSKPFSNYQLASKGAFIQRLGKFKERPEAGVFRFDAGDGEPIQVKVAISPTSVEGAKKNFMAEAPHWKFDQYKNEATEIWNRQLQKMEIESKSTDQSSIFYTALYHCFIHPSLNMDVDQQYRGRDNKIHTAKGFTNYSVFSLWDTYRALHPLFTIVERQRTNDFITSFLNQYKESGRLPVWELSSNETDCMIGFHSVSVMADALNKGINGFDTELAFEAAKAASNYTGFGIPVFNAKGFLEIDDESESVSRTLEYAYDNWCIAQMAGKLNKTDDYFLYLKRAQGYKHVFDGTSGFMRPRKNGNWLSPFYASEINNHFTEGNSWQYSFYVPQDVEGLMNLHGGKINFEKKLDLLFQTTEKTRGREQADVTGLIGQYAHGNEPSHHMAYLYNYVGKPQKTIDRVHRIRTNFYKNAPDGLIGNEDCGQMSAWYIFSSMGFYPLCPGSPLYLTSEPAFKQVKINLEDGVSFSILCDKTPGSNLKGLSVNGNPHQLSAINHEEIMQGGSLVFSYQPTKEVFGNLTAPSSIPGPQIIPAPLIQSLAQVFKKELEVKIAAINSGSVAKCYYTLDGSEPTQHSILYAHSFTLSSNTTIKAKTYANNDSSCTVSASFFKTKYDFDIQISSKANSQYAADGTQTMIDGITASENWRKGNWLGYQGQDFVCKIDRKENKEFDYISVNFLQDSRSWILFPKEMEIYTSEDNVSFTLAGNVICSVSPKEEKVFVQKFEKQFPQKMKARCLKIVAKNFGKLPEWHQGKGGEAFIFVDELELR
jgi:predicted alpha-1,2-mannosidase